MTSDQGKQKTVFQPAAKARSARLRRSELRKTKSYLRKESEFGGSTLLPCPEWRSVTLEKVTTTEGKGEAPKASKLKGIAGNTMSSGISSPSCSDHGQMKGKVQIGNEESSQKLVAALTSGSVSLIGRRRKMEDAVTVAPGPIAGEYSFFAVYDGHGGDSVSNACSKRLHKLLENELQEAKWTTSTGNVEWNKVLAACFSRMDDEVMRTDDQESEETVGSTAVVVIVGKEEVVVANCGDSRAVLCRGGIPIPLSDDHKPERPDERERVEAAGGRIIDWDGCRVQGVLSTSRSIGDHYLKPYVISEPQVTLTRRTDSDEFLIIATDGLWDVVSNEFACEVVRRCIDGRIKRNTSTELIAADAAAILAELAVAKGSRDNISIILVDLKNKI